MELFGIAFIVFLTFFVMCRGVSREIRRVRALFIEEPIHDAFGLSYTNYYVMPRVVLQSMPVEWQRQFVALSEEIYRHLDYEDPDYCVLRCQLNGEEYDEEAGEMVHCTETCLRYCYDPLSEYRHNRIERRAKTARTGV